MVPMFFERFLRIFFSEDNRLLIPSFSRKLNIYRRKIMLFSPRLSTTVRKRNATRQRERGIIIVAIAEATTTVSRDVEW